MAAVQIKNPGKVFHKGEIILLSLILVIMNVPLFIGSFSDNFVFYPDLVAAGEWWRVFTFPFVHVSLYHLVLDAVAFLLLWKDLRDLKLLQRWGVLIVCWLMSLAVPLLFSDRLDVYGLCGLSGIGHGLFVFYSLDSARRAKESSDRLLYYVSLLMAVGLVLKSGFETLGGNLFFTSLHFGPIGIPIVEAHLGGAIGGILVYLYMNSIRQRDVKARQLDSSAARGVFQTDL